MPSDSATIDEAIDLLECAGWKGYAQAVRELRDRLIVARNENNCAEGGLVAPIALPVVQQESYINAVIQHVAELPDRTSPDDWPDAMLVTAAELRDILTEHASPVAAAPASFKCKARRTADPPEDCDWPTCGCDPYADKVIAALEESGKLAAPAWQEYVQHKPGCASLNVVPLDIGEWKNAGEPCTCGLDAATALVWHRIETAPKDGKRVLLHPGPKGYPVVGRRSLTNQWWESLPGKYQIQPTHWMPLPGSPRAGEP